MRNVNMQINAAQYLNPNTQGIAEPLILTIYQLKTPMKFKQASYSDLLMNASQKLGDDLIDKESVEVKPSEKSTHAIQIDTDVKYIGIVASYRDINTAIWRTVVVVPSASSKRSKFLPQNKNIPIALNLQSNEMHIVSNRRYWL
jgi:type VI secretion system protein VasD